MIYTGNKLRGLQGEKPTKRRDYIERRLHTSRKKNYMERNYMKEGTIQKEDQTGRNYTRRDYIKEGQYYIKGELYREETTQRRITRGRITQGGTTRRGIIQGGTIQREDYITQRGTHTRKRLYGKRLDRKGLHIEGTI